MGHQKPGIVLICYPRAWRLKQKIMNLRTSFSYIVKSVPTTQINKRVNQCIVTPKVQIPKKISS